MTDITLTDFLEPATPIRTERPHMASAEPDTMCVCIDDDWLGISGLSTQGPRRGEICAIEKVEPIGGAFWYSIKGYSGWMEACAFRPATLSEIIAEYRAQTEAFDQMHRDDMSFVDEQELAARTYEPSLWAFEHPPALTAKHEAIAALELVLENEPFVTESDPALVRRVLEYLKQN